MHFPLGLKEDTGEMFPMDAAGKYAFSDVDYLDAWKGMEEAYRLGLAKEIGISNFNREQIERLLLNSSIQPAVHQVRISFHEYYRR